MELFKKLKDGRIILVMTHNAFQRTLHGYNIGSPNLIHKNFSSEDIDESWICTSVEIKFVFLTYDRKKVYECKHHPHYITTERITNIANKIFETERKELVRSSYAA